jgi:hypothetical protein
MGTEIAHPSRPKRSPNFTTLLSQLRAGATRWIWFAHLSVKSRSRSWQSYVNTNRGFAAHWMIVQTALCLAKAAKSLGCQKRSKTHVRLDSQCSTDLSSPQPASKRKVQRLNCKPAAGRRNFPRPSLRLLPIGGTARARFRGGYIEPFEFVGLHAIEPAVRALASTS